ncbi:MAG: DUF1772 domain-containing protein [Marinosulfonomonas sp.]|nr:DUF1772 domain-containing protein [Marinosulfonomonas sp.]
MSLWFFVLCQFSILAYAILGGVFLAFSDFIMRALANTSGTGGIEAMQVINREVFRYVFMILFIGMAAISVLIAGYSGFNQSGPAAYLIAGAALVYLIGGFGVTVVFNVPLNEVLATMDTSSKATHDFWTNSYLPRWTFWNSVRTVACILAAGLLLIGLVGSVPASAS